MPTQPLGHCYVARGNLCWASCMIAGKFPAHSCSHPPGFLAVSPAERGLRRRVEGGIEKLGRDQKHSPGHKTCVNIKLKRESCLPPTRRAAQIRALDALE